MSALRRLILSRPLLMGWLCVAVLAMKLLVPSGYMISGEGGRVAIILCSGVAPSMAAPSMIGTSTTGPSSTGTSMAASPNMVMGDHVMSGHAMPEHDPSTSHGKMEMPCAFSGLSAQALASVDATLLVAAIAFVMAIGIRPARRLVPARASYLRPPLRGPPIAL
ncbi:hypothetical protein U1763_01135 [Sphingomonas sp. LB2R24]|uniref:hypothetical protein n=1 Tax=Sphingomonas sorbitolis TaxID=3096165 RepID=UPI002FC7A44E